MSSPEAAQIYADGTAQFSAVIGVKSESPELEAVTNMLSQYKSYRSGSVYPTDPKFLGYYPTVGSKAFLGENIDSLMAEAQAFTDSLKLNQ